MALGIFSSALKTIKDTNITIIFTVAIAIGVVYRCVSPWLDGDSDKSHDGVINCDKLSDRCLGSNPSVVKRKYKKRKKIIKFIPELTDHDISSTQLLSFKFGSSATTNAVATSQLKDKKIINSTTFKKSNLNSSSITRELCKITTATQTDPILNKTITNYIDIDNLNNSTNYNELKKKDFFSTNDQRPEISVITRKNDKIVKPPRAHPPISRSNISKNTVDNSLSKKNNSLYPEIYVIDHNDSKSFPSISSIDENNNYYQQQSLISSPKKTFNNNLIFKKSKSFIKKCRRILNLNNNNSKSKSTSKSKSKSIDTTDTTDTSKSSFLITSALATLPVGHSTFMDINMSQVVAAGGQDKEETKNTQRSIINKKSSKVYTKNNHQLINYPHFEQSVIDKKNVIVEINSQNRPECRIVNNDDENIFNLCQDDDNNNNNNESSCITGFTKDLHQIFKDVKSYFRISSSYHNLNNKSNWTINMSTLKKSTSFTLLKKSYTNINKCYSL
ncbi:putative uncharacterized protein DDB_G0282499 [Microplitis mediator]|uniref:putative uncharacterized protein DDB_G0282499 n=1 Tax=Microplitis mediator TaxID=375433 RepID=UPI002556F055|nr:putative uncharacterized protein DDB_G0282499 [Microplitis mediator]